VEHLNDLDETRPSHAKEDHMHRVRYPALAALVATVTNVEVADAGQKV